MKPGQGVGLPGRAPAQVSGALGMGGGQVQTWAKREVDICGQGTMGLLPKVQTPNICCGSERNLMRARGVEGRRDGRMNTGNQAWTPVCYQLAGQH